MREYNRKFFWVFRASEIGKFKYLRDDLYKWNTKNRGFLSFDFIKALRVARIGWFENLHLDIHNPRDFKDYIIRKLLDIEHALNFDIFKQKLLSNARTNR